MRRKFSFALKTSPLVAIFLCALLSTARPDSAGSWSFVVLGDSRDNPATFDKIISLVAKDQSSPELLFHTGDMVNRGCNKKAWAQYEKTMSNLKGKIEVYPVVGNHETILDKKTKNYLKFAQPPDKKLYYSIKHKNAGFVVLDTYEPGHSGSVGPEQVEWLKKTLAAMKTEVPNIFILMHKPLMTRPAYRHSKPLENAAEIKKILKDAGVKVVFQGHEHRYDRQEEDGIQYVITAGAGAPLYGSDEDALFHYIRATISEKGIKIALIDEKGAERKEITIQ